MSRREDGTDQVGQGLWGGRQQLPPFERFEPKDDGPAPPGAATAGGPAFLGRHWRLLLLEKVAHVATGPGPRFARPFPATCHGPGERPRPRSPAGILTVGTGWQGGSLRPFHGILRRSLPQSPI